MSSANFVNRLSIVRRVASSAFGSDRKLRIWKDSGFSVPAPLSVKHAVLRREAFHPGSWIETGTYLGQTTAVISSHGEEVVSIEANKDLFERATRLFSNSRKVKIIHADSGKALDQLLPQMSGAVNFWLDAHYSGPGTHWSGGKSPIFGELSAIENWISESRSVCVFVDDFRCFGDEAGEYPEKSFLVNWAVNNNLRWSVEHDIFIAKSNFGGLGVEPL